MPALVRWKSVTSDPRSPGGEQKPCKHGFICTLDPSVVPVVVLRSSRLGNKTAAREIKTVFNGRWNKDKFYPEMMLDTTRMEGA